MQIAKTDSISSFGSIKVAKYLKSCIKEYADRQLNIQTISAKSFCVIAG